MIPARNQPEVAGYLAQCEQGLNVRLPTLQGMHTRYAGRDAHRLQESHVCLSTGLQSEKASPAVYLSEATMGLAWQSGDTPAGDHTLCSATTGDGNGVDHLILAQHCVHRDGLLKVLEGEVNLLCQISATIHLDTKCTLVNATSASVTFCPERWIDRKLTSQLHQIADGKKNSVQRTFKNASQVGHPSCVISS